MTVQNLKLANVIDVNEEEYSIPLDISDIINICREYSKLGWQIQSQIEFILDFGVKKSIEIGYVKVESLPHIKNFFCSIINNSYFGDACYQSSELIEEINCIIEKNSLCPTGNN